MWIIHDGSKSRRGIGALIAMVVGLTGTMATAAPFEPVYSDRVDFLRIQSSLDPSIEFAIAVHKPDRPGPIVMGTHGWHGNVRSPEEVTEHPYPGFLYVEVDMRGRRYSTGQPDASGYELFDVYDALEYVRRHYARFISDPEQVSYCSESGGGGNGLAMAGKFPDLFCAVVVSSPMSDYALWYRQDSLGEFRDEMLVWIGGPPDEMPEAYATRSGVTAAGNILSPVYLMHGATDEAVPVVHSRRMARVLRMLGKRVDYLELAGVGTQRHWGNATPEQLAALDRFRDQALRWEKQVPRLPRSGQLLVPGYVVTEHFRIFMDSVNELGVVVYDLDQREAELVAGQGTITWR